MPQNISFQRASLVLAFLAIMLTGMTMRVAYLQSYGRTKSLAWAERQQFEMRMIPARRGNIYDRNGVLMAGSVQTLAVYIDPKFMQQEYQKKPRNLNQMDEDLRKLARIIEVDSEKLITAISERADSRYAKIVENQSERTCKEIEKLKIPGVGIEPMFVRFYPMGSTAAHVLGGCGDDGTGLEGIELKYQKELAGRDGYSRIEKDAGRRPIGLDDEDYAQPIHGQHMVLTLDANIQMIVEQELYDACARFKAKRGESVVLDAKTGEILALANYPTYNPQNISDSKPEDRRNAAIMMPYEPGSTIKPFIVGPALTLKITRPEEVWNVPGTYNPYGNRTIRDTHHYGPLTTWDILVKSSNIGDCLIAERMGNPKVHAGLTGFGFGRRTGVELPGEDPGLLFPLSRWSHFSTDSVAQGYEIMVTPLQIARAFMCYATDGRLLPVTIVKGGLDSEGNIAAAKPPVDLSQCPKVVSDDAAANIRRILADVPVRGTGVGKVICPYWNVYGKTGTAHISKGAGGYSDKLYNSSFICAAPYEDPRIVVAMVIHEPDEKLGYYGATVSGPPAGSAVERTLGYLKVPQSPVLPQPPANVIPHLVNFQPGVYAKLSAAGKKED